MINLMHRTVKNWPPIIYPLSSQPQITVCLLNTIYSKSPQKTSARVYWSHCLTCKHQATGNNMLMSLERKLSTDC